MHAESIMSTKIITVDIDDSLIAVKAIFDSAKFHHLLVTEEGKLVGIISDKDYFTAVRPHLGTRIESAQDRADLQKRAHQIMTPNPITASANTTIGTVIQLFQTHTFSCVPITNAQQQPIGIISWRDLLRSVPITNKGKAAESFMCKRLVTIGMDDSLTEVKAIFNSHSFHHLLVVDEDKLTGVISDRDYIHALNPNLGTELESQQDRDTLHKKTHQIMTRKPITIMANERIQNVVEIFNTHNISCIPVVNKQDRAVGIITWRDILNTFDMGSENTSPASKQDPFNQATSSETTFEELETGALHINVKIQKLAHGQGLDLPFYATEHAAGADLRAAVKEDVTLAPGEHKLIKTGFAMALPDGFEAQIRPRSGLAYKFGITVLNSPGTIDADYRGEIGVILINHGQQPFVITRGERIAQMIVAPFVQAAFTEVGELSETVRGEGGFGSSGRK